MAAQVQTTKSRRTQYIEEKLQTVNIDGKKILFTSLQQKKSFELKSQCLFPTWTCLSLHEIVKRKKFPATKLIMST